MGTRVPWGRTHLGGEGQAMAEGTGEAKGVSFGLVGHPLGHSWSPQIHTLLGSVPYLLHDLEADGAERFIEGGGWQGLNVTIPHKALAARLADERTEAVGRLGVANTLMRRPDGTILADNTDLWGFSWMLGRFSRLSMGREPRQWLPGRECLVLGSGGASRSVVAALEDVGARPVVVSRSGPVGYEGLAEAHHGCALVVNATPVGMAPRCPASPLAPGVLGALRPEGVLDVIYNPARTRLVLEARDLGIPAEGGLAMLCAQAWASSRVWDIQDSQGTFERDDAIERIMAALTRSHANVFLCGMPGCGKTGAARRLAHMAHRPFIDLDDAFAVEQGISPADFITSQGEERFRELESQVLASYGARSGLVVATGGGVVTREANRELMAQNGTIVLLDRPLGELSRHGRPLTLARGVEALAAERMPTYRAWADIELKCTGSAEGDAVAIGQMLGILPSEVDQERPIP